ncbi:MAG: TRAP transporter small permease subunit [Polaromonas sp.]|nr:TRAP transporter small permease subunit [Polaromonas sp.]
MQKAFTKFDRTIGFLEDFVSIWTIVFISIIVVVQVFFRYVLDSGILWSDEVITILMVSMVMFGVPAVTRRGMHTELHVFINLLPRSARHAVRFATSLIGLAFLVLFFVAAARYAMDSRGMVTTVLRIPIQFVYAILPIGAFLAIYEYLKTVIVEFRSSSH